MVESIKANSQLQVVKGVVILNGIIAVLAMALMKQGTPFLLGLFFGTTIALLNFRLLYLTLKKAVKMPPGKAQVYASSQYLMRYLLTGIVVFVAIRNENLNVIGTIIGLISIKLVIIKQNLLNSKTFFRNIFIRREEE